VCDGDGWSVWSDENDTHSVIIRVRSPIERGCMSQNYYDILEVSPNASQTVIAAAYRTLSQRYHPDKNNGDKNCEDMMAAINVAFCVLSDSIKRKLYDDEIGLTKSNINLEQVKQTKIEPEIIKEKIDSLTGNDALTFFMLLGVGALVVIALNWSKLIEPQPSQVVIPINFEIDKANKSWLNAETLLTGNGQSQNYLKALEEYKKIYESKLFNDGRAQQRIAEIYFYGLGQNIDYTKAMEWYKKTKNAESEYMIGVMYLESLGVKKDLIKAYYYFNKLQVVHYASGRDYSFNPLITEQQRKFIDIKGYEGVIFTKLYGFGYQMFAISAGVKKKLLERQLSVNEINQAQNLSSID